MRGRFATLVFVVAAGAFSAPAAAMSAADQQPRHCRVIAGDKLPAATGGAKALCAAVERAVRELAPNARYRAEVKVLTPSSLATSLVVNGRALPERRFAVMDRELGEGSIRRFANSIAAEVAKAANR